MEKINNYKLQYFISKEDVLVNSFILHEELFCKLLFCSISIFLFRLFIIIKSNIVTHYISAEGCLNTVSSLLD